MPKAWMREIQITLTSKKLGKRVTFGTNTSKGQDDLSISVTGTKYLSSLKDAFTIKICNLTYSEICEIINGQYYDVEIKAGYRTSGIHTIFKGGVLYITNVFGDRKTNDCMIFCAANIIAKYGQSRLNLSINSGINMKAAIEFLARRAGITNSNISKEFANRIFRESQSAATTIGSWLDVLCNSNNFIVNSDESYNAAFTLLDPYRTDARLIGIDKSSIILTSGYPTLTSDGVRIVLMPTFNFMCGDTLVLDNAILDMGFTDASQWTKNYGYFMDKDGKYVIYQIDYSLENRGSDFEAKMLCKSKSLLSSLAKGGKND